MVQIKNNEQLLSVKSIVNNTLLDFTILEVTTNKKKYNVTLNFTPVATDKFGIIYKYTNTLEDWLKKNNIKTDIYDFSNNIDLIQRDSHNPLKCFNINIYNCI